MKFACYDSDREVRTQIYADGRALTYGEIADLLRTSVELARMVEDYGAVLQHKSITPPFMPGVQETVRDNCVALVSKWNSIAEARS